MGCRPGSRKSLFLHATCKGLKTRGHTVHIDGGDRRENGKDEVGGESRTGPRWGVELVVDLSFARGEGSDGWQEHYCRQARTGCGDAWLCVTGLDMGNKGIPTD